MKIIKQITFLAIVVMSTISCKKTNNAAYSDTTVGTWKLINIQGNITTTTNSASGSKTDIFVTSYDNINKTKSQKMNNDNPEVYPYTLLLDIKALQVLSVNETRTQGGMSYNDTYPGTWSKYVTDNTITLVGFENTDFYGDFGSNKFVVTTSTASSLVLTYLNTATTASTSQTVKTAYTLTFSK